MLVFKNDFNLFFSFFNRKQSVIELQDRLNNLSKDRHQFNIPKSYLPDQKHLTTKTSLFGEDLKFTSYEPRDFKDGDSAFGIDRTRERSRGDSLEHELSERYYGKTKAKAIYYNLGIDGTFGDIIKEEEDESKADEERRLKLEEDRRRRAERRAQEEAEWAKLEEERRAKKEADKRAREEAELAAMEEEEARRAERKRAREEAERLTKEEAEKRAREEAERRAKEEEERKAKEEADRKAKEEAERLAKEEAERKAKEEAERKAKEEAERKAKIEAEKLKKIRESKIVFVVGGPGSGKVEFNFFFLSFFS